MVFVHHRSVALLTLVLLLSAPPTVRGNPPAGQAIDPEMHAWYESLKQPSSGAPCCSVADCRPFNSRIAKDHYEVYIHGRWYTVPNAVVLHEPNRAGSAVACLETIWNYDLGPAPANFSPKILCFLPASEV